MSKIRHFLTLLDFERDEILAMIDIALKLKSLKNHTPYLRGKVLGMIFEKSSTRTRVSFESGIFQLGGLGIFLSKNDIQLGRGEPIKDTARVVSSMVDLVMMRTSEHSRLLEFAKHSAVPLINGLSDDFHPMQLMADYLTMVECGIYVGRNPHYPSKNGEPIVAYVGDGNNMAHSWINLAAILGFELRIASPSGYEPKREILDSALDYAKNSGAKISLGNDVLEAVSGANVVTTDTWASMGQESEKEVRVKAFSGFCVDEKVMSYADKNAIFLHCLPAYRGYEVSEGVIDGERSRIYQEANNRLHAQKAVMIYLSKINGLLESCDLM